MEKKPRSLKFVQIAVSEDEESIHLYALSDKGIVYLFDHHDKTWEALPGVEFKR